MLYGEMAIATTKNYAMHKNMYMKWEKMAIWLQMQGVNRLKWRETQARNKKYGGMKLACIRV